MKQRVCFPSGDEARDSFNRYCLENFCRSVAMKTSIYQYKGLNYNRNGNVSNHRLAV